MPAEGAVGCRKTSHCNRGVQGTRHLGPILRVQLQRKQWGGALQPPWMELGRPQEDGLLSWGPAVREDLHFPLKVGQESPQLPAKERPPLPLPPALHP